MAICRRHRLASGFVPAPADRREPTVTTREAHPPHRGCARHGFCPDDGRVRWPDTSAPTHHLLLADQGHRCRREARRVLAHSYLRDCEALHCRLESQMDQRRTRTNGARGAPTKEGLCGQEGSAESTPLPQCRRLRQGGNQRPTSRHDQSESRLHPLQSSQPVQRL